MNKGSILIATLIIIAIAASLALTINTFSIKKISNIRQLKDNYQAAIYANNVIKLIDDMLRNQQNIINPNNRIFNLPEIPIDNGIIKISIKPLNAKINLNLLKTGLNVTRKRVLCAVNSLLEQNNLPDNYIDTLLKWLGIKGSNYEVFSTDWSCKATYKRKLLDTLYEINYIPFCGHKLYDIFKNSFTVISDNPKININFANQQTLSLYLPEISQYVAKIIEYRKKSPFVDVSMIRNICNISDQTYLKILPFITTTSNIFYVKIFIILNNTSYCYHYVIKKDKNYIKILKYIEAGSNDYF